MRAASYMPHFAGTKDWGVQPAVAYMCKQPNGPTTAAEACSFYDDCMFYLKLKMHGFSVTQKQKDTWSAKAIKTVEKETRFTHTAATVCLQKRFPSTAPITITSTSSSSPPPTPNIQQSTSPHVTTQNPPPNSSASTQPTNTSGTPQPSQKRKKLEAGIGKEIDLTPGIVEPDYWLNGMLYYMEKNIKILSLPQCQYGSDIDAPDLFLWLGILARIVQRWLLLYFRLLIAMGVEIPYGAIKAAQETMGVKDIVDGVLRFESDYWCFSRLSNLIENLGLDHEFYAIFPPTERPAVRRLFALLRMNRNCWMGHTLIDKKMGWNLRVRSNGADQAAEGGVATTEIAGQAVTSKGTSLAKGLGG
ncbi:hypothetical protein HK097_007828, partial [Rhizophlyctis rosea]